MAEITYVKGNAVYPQGEGNKIIAHVCNNIGAWGAGFVLAISKRWSEPEREYRSMSSTERKLGNVQFVPVETDIVVANMIGQENIKANDYGVPPVRYSAIKICLERVLSLAKSMNASIHMPRIGCGLAGGQWEIMEQVIIAASKNFDVKIFVYDFK